jgi:hypothetical protein
MCTLCNEFGSWLCLTGMRLLVTVQKVGALLANMAPINHFWNRTDTVKCNISFHSSSCTLHTVCTCLSLIHMSLWYILVTWLCYILSWGRIFFGLNSRGLIVIFLFECGLIVSEVTCYVDGDLVWGSMNILVCHGSHFNTVGAILWHISGLL